MGCLSSKPAPPPAARSERPSPRVIPQEVRAPEPESQRSSANAARGSPQVEMRERPHRLKSKSTPEHPLPTTASEEVPQVPIPSQRSRAKSSAAPTSRRPSTPTRAELPRPSPRRPTLSNPSRRPLKSTVQQILPDKFKFRILVVGKRGSGKSSLIKAVFKVDVTAAPERAPGKADIDVEFHPEDNRYLIVHESSGLDSRAGDSQDLEAIQTFISRRTDATCSPPDRLHAIWICVPASDAVDGRLGDGVEEILALRNVPVILVLTKFDALVSQAVLDISSDEPQHYERARARAHAMYEESCRRIFHKEPSDVPAGIVSEKARFIDLIDNLVATTDRFITGSRASSSRAGGQGTKQRLGAVPLAWSAAVRVNHDVIIQTSIEVGRSRYWRSLWSSLDFADQRLKDCVRIIHDDMVEIWNLNDKTRYLLGNKFKANMSHLIKDLSGSSNATSSSERTGASDAYADWTHDSFRGSQENVRCVVGYIVDLTVILDGIFRVAAGDMSSYHAEQVLERHISSGRRDVIHRDIRRFITEAFAIKPTVRKDLILEKIIDLITQFCVPPP